MNLDPTSAPVISKLGSKVLHYFGCGRFLKHTRARANKSDQTELLANCGLIHMDYMSLHSFIPRLQLSHVIVSFGPAFIGDILVCTFIITNTGL